MKLFSLIKLLHICFLKLYMKFSWKLLLSKDWDHDFKVATSNVAIATFNIAIVTSDVAISTSDIAIPTSNIAIAVATSEKRGKMKISTTKLRGKSNRHEREKDWLSKLRVSRSGKSSTWSVK